MRKKKNKAQSFLNYAMLLSLAAAALVAMRVYVLRGVQEKFRQSADVFGQGEQYAPHGRTQVTLLANTESALPAASVATMDPCNSIRARADWLERSVYGYNYEQNNHVAGELERLNFVITAVQKKINETRDNLAGAAAGLQESVQAQPREASAKERETIIDNLIRGSSPEERRVLEADGIRQQNIAGRANTRSATEELWHNLATLREALTQMPDREKAALLEKAAQDAGSVFISADFAGLASEAQVYCQNALRDANRYLAGIITKQKEINQLRQDNAGCFN